jgi:hypothetical protein
VSIDRFIDSGGATADELRDQYLGTRRSHRTIFVHRHLLRCAVNNAPPGAQKNSSKSNLSPYYNNDGPQAA